MSFVVGNNDQNLNTVHYENINLYILEINCRKIFLKRWEGLIQNVNIPEFYHTVHW